MLADRLYLIWNYGKTHFLLGGLYNLACAAVVLSAFSVAVIVDALIIKAVVAALIFYLISQFRKAGPYPRAQERYRHHRHRPQLRRHLPRSRQPLRHLGRLHLTGNLPRRPRAARVFALISAWEG